MMAAALGYFFAFMLVGYPIFLVVTFLARAHGSWNVVFVAAFVGFMWFVFIMNGDAFAGLLMFLAALAVHTVIARRVRPPMVEAQPPRDDLNEVR